MKFALHICTRYEAAYFFSESGQSVGLPNAVLEYIPGFIDPNEADRLLATFITNTLWTQKTVKIYDKHVPTPRLLAWYGDIEGLDYSALGKSVSLPWSDELLGLKKLAEQQAGISFQCALELL